MNVKLKARTTGVYDVFVGGERIGSVSNSPSHKAWVAVNLRGIVIAGCGTRRGALRPLVDQYTASLFVKNVHATAAQIMHDDLLDAAQAYHEAFRAIDPAWHEKALASDSARNLPSMLYAWHRDHKEVS